MEGRVTQNWPSTSATCAIEGCEQDSFVGVGDPARWVCFEHYEAYLARAREVMDALREATS